MRVSQGGRRGVHGQHEGDGERGDPVCGGERGGAGQLRLYGDEPRRLHQHHGDAAGHRSANRTPEVFYSSFSLWSLRPRCGATSVIVGVTPYPPPKTAGSWAG